MELTQDWWGRSGSREGVMSDRHAWTVIDLLIIFGPVVFLLPTLIGFLRNSEEKELLFLINLLALVTCGMAWFVALYYAFRFPRKLPRSRRSS
jgi:hypothetical protein